LTSGTFGVDLIYAQTGLGPASTTGHVDACIDLAVPLVIFHHDVPPAAWISRLKAAGTRVWVQVSSPELAAAAIGRGADGLVAQGREAGGHARGTIGLLPLLREIRCIWPEGLMLGAGGISDGAAVASALRAGADGVWVGTRLVVADEANAHPEYKRRLVASDGATLRTSVFGPEWPGQPYRLSVTVTATATVRAADRVGAVSTRGGPIGASTAFACGLLNGAVS
jgi:nitronate monooxygenase